MTVDARLRAWWFHRQGLDGALIGRTPAETLDRCGWARSVGGSGPYLTLFARAGTSREAADAAVAKTEICELPAARGCTYVLPSSDFALGLKVGELLAGTEMKVALKLGVTEKEIEKLCDVVLKALAKGPLDPNQIRDATGSASRSLGEEGKKKGVTTTLPLALGKLQTTGEIRRISLNGRLDHQRYSYTLWRPNPLAKFKLSLDESFTELARKYFSWIGPAAISEFQEFSGLGVKAAKAALDPLHLEPLAAGSGLLFLPGERANFESFTLPKDPQYALISLLDAVILNGGRHKLLVDASDGERRIFVEKDYQPMNSLSHLPSNAILDRGRLVGLWEYDTETESIAWLPFIKKNRELEKAVARTEEYVRTQLGDARSFALDSPKSRAPRLAALRKGAGA